jgi:flavin reductase (DIM6/NTAB) family NADH-FMN oxidoreductase RutF
MSKIPLGSIPYIYPIPIILAGANVNGKPNFATIGDCGLMGIRPPLVFISSGKDHYTNQGILENETFSINFPTTDMLPVVDYCGVVSGKDVDKSALFPVFYGDMKTAPMIETCPVNLECKVVKEFSIQHRQVFVAEVAQAFVEEAFITEENGRKSIAELARLDPILYALDNRYYRVGPAIGTGYKEHPKYNSPTSEG